MLIFDTIKTGVRCELGISAKTFAVLPNKNSNMTFLLSALGVPYGSDKALSQRVSKWFSQAGIEKITAHSVRKWLATKMAEDGATEMELMAFFGWRDPKEARPYVQKANRRKLAAQAQAKIQRL
jgi:integrase